MQIACKIIEVIFLRFSFFYLLFVTRTKEYISRFELSAKIQKINFNFQQRKTENPGKIW